MKFFLALVPLVLLFTACPDDDMNGDDVATVEVNFKALFADQDLAIQAGNYAYIDGTSELLISLFQFYISDLELVPVDGGDPVQLAEVELIRWNNSTDPAELKFDYPNVPVGSYTVRFGLGVREDLNNTNPNQFAADYALNENEFWNENARYVFAKIEGNANLEGDGLFDTPLVYHMGKNEFYTTLSYPGTIEIGIGGDNSINFQIDVQDMMARSATEFTDIQNTEAQVINHPNNPITAQQFANLRESILVIR